MKSKKTLKNILKSICLAGTIALSSCYIERHSTEPQIIYVTENPKIKLTDEEKINVGDYNISIGDRATILNWKWVDVVNSYPITRKFSNGSDTLEYGEICGVEEGGNIDVFGFTKDKRVLVKYTAPGNPIGTPCPTGILYLLQPDEFIDITSRTPGKFCIHGKKSKHLKNNELEIRMGESKK